MLTVPKMAHKQADIYWLRIKFKQMFFYVSFPGYSDSCVLRTHIRHGEFRDNRQGGSLDIKAGLELHGTCLPVGPTMWTPVVRLNGNSVDGAVFIGWRRGTPCTNQLPFEVHFRFFASLSADAKSKYLSEGLVTGGTRTTPFL